MRGSEERVWKGKVNANQGKSRGTIEEQWKQKDMKFMDLKREEKKKQMTEKQRKEDKKLDK